MSTGADHKTSVGEQRRDAPVSQGIESAARADTAARYHISRRDGRSERRRGEPYLHRCQSFFIKYTGRRRRSLISSKLIAEFLVLLPLYFAEFPGRAV